jgi:type IX secretion system PorP/SprF family membrane protein
MTESIIMKHRHMENPVRILGAWSAALFFSLACQTHARAQDPHFSQYFASPLTLNPANTGNYDYPSRIATNFRSQWQGIGQPFLTGTVSFDGHLFKERMGDRSKFAAGVLGLFDQTAGGLYRGNYMAASFGYHQILDEDYTSQLSVGFQASLVNKRLDVSRISFAEQFAGTGFDLSRPSNQSFQNTSIGYLDVNAGLLYTKTWEGGSLYAGASAYHLGRPRESFLGNNDVFVDIRYTAHLGATVNFGRHGVLMGTFHHMAQGVNRQNLAGIAYGYQLENELQDIIFYLGGWCRFGDAIIPYIGYQYSNLQFGLSYDVTTSGLNLTGTRNRSFEVSLIYHFLDNSEYRRAVPWY